MKTFYLLIGGVFVLSGLAFAQPSSFQIGLNVVPLVDRTLELNATLARNPEYEFYIHGGYSFPKLYAKNQAGAGYSSDFWEGTASGAYLKLGARAYLNPSGKLRTYFGAHLTAGYLLQAGKSIWIINCIIGPCPPIKSEGRNEQYSLSGGITAGARTNITPHLTLDLGVQANRFVFEKPDLNTSGIYIPGYGRRPLQAVASLQYTLKD